MYIIGVASGTAGPVLAGPLFGPMTTPTITSTLCACSEFFNRGHQVKSEPCRCFVGEMDCVIPSQPHQPPASFTFPKRSFGKKTPVLRSFQHA